MSTETPPRGHRYSQSAAMLPASASSQNPQSPPHLSQQSHTRISHSGSRISQPGSASQSTTPPRTPRRETQPPQNATNTNAPESGSKQKPRNKNRPKNVMTSPAVTRNGRSTPPLTGSQSASIPSSAKPINTPSTAAYAGPTFHASPAPSALPIPSFFSKSVPDSPGLKGLKAAKEPQVKKETSSLTNPFTPPPANPQVNLFPREESPLDIFFKADREEKARARSASSTQTAAPVTGPFQPPFESPRSSQTPPALPTHSRPRRGHASRVSANGMFAMELDGETDPGTPYGPSFSTPYTERIHAARASSQPVQSSEATSDDPQKSLDRSEALKAYLFSGHPLLPSDGTSQSGAPTASPLTPNLSSTAQKPPTHASGLRSAGLPTRPHHNSHSLTHDQRSSSHLPRPAGRSSGLRQEVTPSKTPTSTPDRNGAYSQSPTIPRMYENTSSAATNSFDPIMASYTPSPGPTSDVGMSSENRASDLQGMEESLRRILKLDSARSSGVTGGSAPSASASVPNYGGGRPPSMNGMHNGVMGS